MHSLASTRKLTYYTKSYWHSKDLCCCSALCECQNTPVVWSNRNSVAWKHFERLSTCSVVHFQVTKCHKSESFCPKHVACPCCQAALPAPGCWGLSISHSHSPSALYEEGAFSPLFCLVHVDFPSLGPQGLCFSMLWLKWNFMVPFLWFMISWVVSSQRHSRDPEPWQCKPGAGNCMTHLF